MTPFGARLRALRAERGLTLKHLAEGLQVSAAYLSALETIGARMPDVEQLEMEELDDNASPTHP